VSWSHPVSTLRGHGNDQARRGSGEGSVYQETRTLVGPDGLPMATLWVATVEDQRSLTTGKRRQVKLRAKTKAAAIAKASGYRKQRAAGIVRLHLIPALGRVKLRSLTPEHVDALSKAKADSGLSKRYVGRMRSILTDALTHAERRSLVTGNASRLSIMPACTPTPEPRSLTDHEAEALVAAAQTHRLGVMLTTMVIVGLRPRRGDRTALVRP
jgi:hypothetical protein